MFYFIFTKSKRSKFPKGTSPHKPFTQSPILKPSPKVSTAMKIGVRKFDDSQGCVIECHVLIVNNKERENKKKEKTDICFLDS